MLFQCVVDMNLLEIWSIFCIACIYYVLKWKSQRCLFSAIQIKCLCHCHAATFWCGCGLIPRPPMKEDETAWAEP
jgi:hypothetical protein